MQYTSMIQSIQNEMLETGPNKQDLVTLFVRTLLECKMQFVSNLWLLINAI